MLAFEKAAELSIDGLEMDIHATKDGVLVVSHDESVDRMTNGNGRIQDFTLAELQQLDAGYRFTLDSGQTYPFRGQGLTIPTMEEVLQRFPDLWINVDIKHHDNEVVEKFCALISNYNAHQRFCVGSFSAETVKHFRTTCRQVVALGTKPEIAQLLILSKLHLEGWFKGGRPIQVPPRESYWGNPITIVTPRFVEAAHKRGTAVHLWTINEKREMQHYIDMGVDGLITNYPDRALELLGRL